MVDKYYTVDDVAELIKIHPKTIQRYIREGRLKANKVGKGWRISGHDLSTFTEGNNFSGIPPIDSGPESDDNGNRIVRKSNEEKIKVSAVIDIPVPDTQEAVRIANTLTAISNSKPPEAGASSVQTQYLMTEKVIRVMIWGDLQFTQVILDAIGSLTEDN